MFKDKLVSSDEFIASIAIDWVPLIMQTKPTSDEWVAFIHVESEVTGKYSFMKCFHVWMLHAITCLLLVQNQWLGKQTAYPLTKKHQCVTCLQDSGWPGATGINQTSVLSCLSGDCSHLEEMSLWYTGIAQIPPLVSSPLKQIVA